MSLEENASPWKKREAQQSLQDDRKNRFERHQEVIDAQRRNTNAHDERVEHRESQRRAWTHQSDTHRTVSGVTLDPLTAKLKVASDADRERRRNAHPVVIPPISTVIAVIDAWQRSQSHFFESAFNYSSLVNYIVTGIAEGWLTLSVEAVADAYVWLLQNGYVETAPDEYFDPTLNAMVRKRSDTNTLKRPAPTLFPRYIWPAEEAAAREAEIAQAVAHHEAGRQEAQTRPFHELQAEVRKSFKPPKPIGRVIG
jgi:hypothetical protein